MAFMDFLCATQHPSWYWRVISTKLIEECDSGFNKSFGKFKELRWPLLVSVNSKKVFPTTCFGLLEPAAAGYPKHGSTGWACRSSGSCSGQEYRRSGRRSWNCRSWCCHFRCRGCSSHCWRSSSNCSIHWHCGGWCCHFRCRGCSSHYWRSSSNCSIHWHCGGWCCHFRCRGVQQPRWLALRRLMLPLPLLRVQQPLALRLLMLPLLLRQVQRALLEQRRKVPLRQLKRYFSLLAAHASRQACFSRIPFFRHLFHGLRLPKSVNKLAKLPRRALCSAGRLIPILLAAAGSSQSVLLLFGKFQIQRPPVAPKNVFHLMIWSKVLARPSFLRSLVVLAPTRYGSF